MEIDTEVKPWVYKGSDVMKIFQIGRNTLWEWNKKGFLTPIKGISQTNYYLVSDVENLKLTFLEYSDRLHE